MIGELVLTLFLKIPFASCLFRTIICWPSNYVFLYLFNVKLYDGLGISMAFYASSETCEELYDKCCSPH